MPAPEAHSNSALFLAEQESYCKLCPTTYSKFHNTYLFVCFWERFLFRPPSFSLVRRQKAGGGKFNNRTFDREEKSIPPEAASFNKSQFSTRPEMTIF